MYLLTQHTVVVVEFVKITHVHRDYHQNQLFRNLKQASEAPELRLKRKNHEEAGRRGGKAIQCLHTFRKELNQLGRGLP